MNKSLNASVRLPVSVQSVSSSDTVARALRALFNGFNLVVAGFGSELEEEQHCQFSTLLDSLKQTPTDAAFFRRPGWTMMRSHLLAAIEDLRKEKHDDDELIGRGVRMMQKAMDTLESLPVEGAQGTLSVVFTVQGLDGDVGALADRLQRVINDELAKVMDELGVKYGWKKGCTPCCAEHGWTPPAEMPKSVPPIHQSDARVMTPEERASAASQDAAAVLGSLIRAMSGRHNVVQ